MRCKIQMAFFFLLIFISCLSCHINCNNLPIVINTWAFTDATDEAWKVLHQPQRTTLDALVEGCSTCERLQCDGTVGYGGSPDEHGETTLDAMIMDGKTMNIGAVAALRNIKDAIKVARYVLLNTRHSMLVGDQATSFAEMIGFKKSSLVTPKSKEIWKKWWNEKCQPNFWVDVMPNPETNCGPYKPIHNKIPVKLKPKKSVFGIKNHDTIGMIVIDSNGHVYAGTSTNGATHKIPGRVGDSPIPGAGAYADNEVGAAAATGDGDVMMRFLPSFVAVENIRFGQDPFTAARGAIERILKYYKEFMGGIVAVNRFGEYGAACTGIDKFPFSVVYGNQTKASIQYIDYLSWLPRTKIWFNTFQVAFGKTEYFVIEKNLEGGYYQNAVITESNHLQDLLKKNVSIIEGVRLQEKNCFILYESSYGILSVYCIDFKEKRLQCVHKNDLYIKEVRQIVSLGNNYIAILLPESVQIWKLNEPTKLIQKIPAATSFQITAAVTMDSKKYLAICSKIMFQSFHQGFVNIFTSYDGSSFEMLQTINIGSPIQIQFASLGESEEILLNILTEDFEKPLSIYQYKGVVGFQPIVSSMSTLPANSVSIVDLRASRQHLIAIISNENINFIEGVNGRV